MKTILLFFFFSTAVLAGDPLFKAVTYYEGLGIKEMKKFRVETVSSWPNCQESLKARKIFLDKTNELREVAYWDQQGKIHEAGKSNKPEVHQRVNDIFDGQVSSGNPCQAGAPGTSSKASEQ